MTAEIERVEVSPSFVAGYERAREAWPGVELPARRYAEAVARVAGDGGDGDGDAGGTARIAALRHADLYLATACIEGVAPGLAAFDALVGRVIGALLARMKEYAFTVQEVVSKLREQLVVTTPSRPPGLSSYRGQGSLEGWLRVTAGRLILELRKLEHRELYARSDRLIELAAGDTDPELLYLKQLYRDEFKQAFARAAAQLQPMQRNLLRYHVLHTMSIDDIAALYGAHRATAARWLVKARRELASRTRDELAARLTLSERDMASVFRLIESQLDVSLAGILS